MEAALTEHPGVRAAAVVACKSKSGEDTLVGYVVPNDGYIESALAGTGEELQRVRKWRAVFDLMQKGKEADAATPGFNIVSWNSSYTRQPIPAAQMRDWVECTVEEILALRPVEVLEIGCGTGLLLLRLAPGCKRYVATDFSPASLKRLKSQMEQLPGSWDSVTLLERAADNFEGFEAGSFDTVVVNSVIQYFPNVAYLTKVLEGAVHITRPGGSIFIGDVRSLPLLEAFAVSVELYQAQPGLSLSDLGERVRRRVVQQDELVISPAFFLALQRNSQKISRVGIKPKHGQFENEMNHFRYDVILHVGTSRDEGASISWLNWTEQELTLEAIGRILEAEKPETLGIRGIRNARIEKDVEALTILSASGNAGSAGELREALQNMPIRGLLPQALRTLAQKLEYDASFSWARSSSDGSYDVLFQRRAADSHPTSTHVAWPGSVAVNGDLASYTNDPGRGALRRKLLPHLQEHIKQRLPESIVTPTILLLDAIPMSPEGHIDRDALPRPDVS